MLLRILNNSRPEKVVAKTGFMAKRLRLRDKKNYACVAGALLVVFAASYLKAAIIIPLFIVIAAASRITQNLFPFVVGFDLCLFLTVLAAYAYGSTAGLVVGLGSGFLGAAIKNSRHAEEKLVFYLGMGAIGFATPLIPLSSILQIGLTATILYDILIVSVYFIMIRKCAINAATFASTHIAFNWWLFSFFGEAVLSML